MGSLILPHPVEHFSRKFTAAEKFVVKKPSCCFSVFTQLIGAPLWSALQLVPDTIVSTPCGWQLISGRHNCCLGGLVRDMCVVERVNRLRPPSYLPTAKVDDVGRILCCRRGVRADEFNSTYTSCSKDASTGSFEPILIVSLCSLASSYSWFSCCFTVSRATDDSWKLELDIGPIF